MKTRLSKGLAFVLAATLLLGLLGGLPALAEEDGTPVAGAAALASAVAEAATDGTETIISLTADITLTAEESIHIAEGQNVIIRSLGEEPRTLTRLTWGEDTRHFTVEGALTLENVVLSGDLDGVLTGGGILVDGEGAALTVRDSQLTDNMADNGGAIQVVAGSVLLESSRVAGNTALENGGGIWLDEAATADLTEGTAIEDNRAGENGGGIYAEDLGGLSTEDTTQFAGNTAIAAYAPPEAKAYGAIGALTATVAGHPLNNYDIHYTLGEKLTVYPVSFDAGDGSDLTFQYIVDGDTATEPQRPELQWADYAFAGWALADGSLWDFTAPVTESLALTAKWTTDAVYTVAFFVDGLAPLAEQLVVEGETAEEPKMEGYAIDGWFTDDQLSQPWDFSTPVDSSIDLYAQLLADINDGTTYTVKFDTWAESTVPDQEVEEDGLVEKPTDPTLTNHKLMYWYTDDGVEWNFEEDTVTEDMTLNARWSDTANNNKLRFGVVFDLNGGTGEVKRQLVLEGNSANEPETPPTRSGYTFIGWSTKSNGTETDLWTFKTDKITKDITLYAVWKEGTWYKVTFDSNGGSTVADQWVENGETATKPSDPTRSGYTFSRWNTSSGSEFNFSTAITENITLTAAWTNNSSNSGSSSSSSSPKTSDDFSATPYVILLLLALAGGTGLMIYRKRRTR